jgi:hypothetical protein
MADTPPPAPPPPASKLRLSVILAQLDDPVAPGAPAPALTLGAVDDRTAHAGFGFLLAFLALVAIPFFGLSTPFGLAVAFLGAQLAAGKVHPWLPGWLRRRVLPAGALRWLSEKLARFAARLERLVRPRLLGLVRGRLVGLGVLLQGVGLALPLPIPGSNWLFLAPILVYAIGLLEDDGGWILVAHAANLVQVGLAIVFIEVVGAAFARIAAWF